MHCVIYKGQKVIDHYLYVEKEDDFSRVPETLLEMLGNLELVISIELNSERKLAQADVNQVIELLKEQGYYFQMPPQINEIQNNIL